MVSTGQLGSKAVALLMVSLMAGSFLLVVPIQVHASGGPPELAPGVSTLNPVTVSADDPPPVDCTVTPVCVYVTDIGSNAIQIIQGTAVVGTVYLPPGSCSLGAAYVPSVEAVYVGDVCKGKVQVINAQTQAIITAISVPSPAGVTYSTVSQMIYVATFTYPSGSVAVINPTTNTVVSSIPTCGSYPEFIDQLNGGNVYTADRLAPSSSVGCVDEINPTTNKLVASVGLSDAAVGVAVNQANNEVYVNGFFYENTYVFTAALVPVTTVSIGAYVWGSWYNSNLATVDTADYFPAGGVTPISTSNIAGAMIPTSYVVNAGCALGPINYAPQYGDSGKVAYINGITVTYIASSGIGVFGCAATTSQYKVTFVQSGLDSSATGTVVTVNSVPVTYTMLPYSIWVYSGTSVTFVWKSPVASSAVGKEFLLMSSSQSSPFKVSSSSTIKGTYWGFVGLFPP